MSPVTGLARFPGRILLSVQMKNFSPVDRDEIQETKPNINLSFPAVVALWTLIFPSFALRIPTAHDFCVISARKLARGRTKLKRFP